MKTSLLPAALVFAALGFAGCAHRDVKYVDPQSTNTVVNVNRINIQDWNMAADKLVSDLLDSGVLERAPEQPAVMAISRIRNNTGEQVDVDNLTKKIRIALSRTGKVVTTTTYGATPEDQMAADTQAFQQFMGGEKQSTTIPYYTLSGKLLADRTNAGDVKQTTYTFQLTLTTTKNGLAAWEAEEQITKQGARQGTIGW
jgi:penicillin-binding protein activator